MTAGPRTFAAAVSLVLGACTDGYPDKNDTLRLEYGMSQQETLHAMNQIGHSKTVKPQVGFVWLDACVLEVHASRQCDGKDSRAIPLRGTEATLEKRADSDSYRLHLRRTTPGEADQTVLHSAPWTEATQMKWLLDYVRRFC